MMLESEETDRVQDPVAVGKTHTFNAAFVSTLHLHR